MCFRTEAGGSVSPRGHRSGRAVGSVPVKVTPSAWWSRGEPMNCYQWVWRALWGPVAGIAIAAAFIVWPLSVVLGLLFISALVAGFATFLYYREPNRPLATRSVALRRSLAVGTRAGACTVALMSLASALPTLAWPLIALCLGTSPVVLRRVRGAVRSTRDSRRRRERAPVEE